MQKIEQKAWGLAVESSQSHATKRLITIAHALRHRGPEGEEKRKAGYGQLHRTARQIVNHSKRVLKELVFTCNN
jgi:hypothetical protein